MDDCQEPDDFYGVPLEQFNCDDLLQQLDIDEVFYLRSLIMCKLQDMAEETIDSFDQANVILAGYRGTNQQSRPSVPK
jgi:hypothetical protein